jgi:adenosine deaminase
MNPHLAALISRLPKAELHLHLEGAVSPRLAAEMQARNGAPAAEIPSGFRDLDSFLAAYGAICRSMRSAADFRAATWETLSRAAASRVRHLELFFSPHAHEGVAYAEMLDGILDAFDAARSRFGMTALLIPAHNRELGPEQGMAFLEMVLSDRRDRVVGIGLDYAELLHPPTPFAAMYARARAAGLQVTAHAGEEGPAAYVRATVELLGCRRVDHGYHVIDDPALVDRCRDLDVLFTVCPTTTLNTTCWRELAAKDHAIRRMIELGLRVSIATDDPGLFATDLDREYGLVTDCFGLSDAALDAIALNGATHCWLPEVERRALVSRFQTDLAAARAAPARPG